MIVGPSSPSSGPELPPMHDTTSDDRDLTPYEPPRLQTLGTLSDLTQGADLDGDADTFGGGFTNSTGPT